MPQSINTHPAHDKVGLYIPENPSPVIAVGGEDRKSFLQGILSQDIVRPEDGSLLFTFFLNPKARILFEAWAAIFPTEILLFPPPGTREDFIAHLKKYLFFRTKATIEDRSGQFRELRLMGPEAVTTLLPVLLPSETPHPVRSIREGGFALLRPPVFQMDAYVGPAVDMFVPVNHFDSIRDTVRGRVLQTGGIELDRQAYETYQTEKGIPEFPSELNENHFPAEVGLDTLGVSYNKGCYVGQEPVTRLKFQGHLNRRLSGFVLDGEPEYAGTVPQPILNPEDGNEAGLLTRYCYSPAMGRTIGIGFLRKAHWEIDPDRELVLADGRRIRVTPLPFV